MGEKESRYFSTKNSEHVAKSMAFFNESEDFDKDPEEPLTSEQVRDMMSKEHKERE